MAEHRLMVHGNVPPPLDREFTVVGKPLNRKDAVEKVTGKALYSGDLRLPGMLYGKILRCPHLRARIVKIDTTRAEALPGVRAIITKENTKGWRTYWYGVSQPAFPEVITYEGQEVAAIAADDVYIAQAALKLIDVEYDVLGHTLNAEENLENPLPSSVAGEEYPENDINDRTRRVVKRGDVAKGFEQADVVLEETYTTQAQYHATIQTRACLVSWDGSNLTVWDALQGIYFTQIALAKSLGLNPENIRVIIKYLGGGFGSKASAHRVTYFAAKLSMLTGKPVRMENTRDEEFITHPHRWDFKVYLKMGVKKNGELTAIYQKAIANIGAAGSYLPNRFLYAARYLYKCPHVHLEQIGVFTNLQQTGPQRGPMNAPSIFALESHIDRLAEMINMDPLEFRLKNYVDFFYVDPEEAIRSVEGLPPIREKLVDATGKIPYMTKNLDKCMKIVTDTIGWERRKHLNDNVKGPKRRGIGFASFTAYQGAGNKPNKAFADVDIFNDGTINLAIGIVDIGGGQVTVFSMIAAEELGVSMEDISVTYGDTKGTRYAPACQSSRVTGEMGPTVLQAAAEARQQLFKLAAPMLEVKPEELGSRNGRIYIKSDPSISIPFKAACARIDPGRPIRGSGSRATNPDSPMVGAFGAQAVELEVDLETGEVNILNVAIAHEFGRALNPKLCESQLLGGVYFGVGYALSEEGIYDPKTGKMLNPNFHQYRLATSYDYPDVKIVIVEGEEPWLAYSGKGGGENANTPFAAAVRNGIHHATGIWLNDLPMTPDKIVNALQEKRKGGSSHAL
ncbi:MAG: xanthine dehydrogenase family protein molybdopterin-binding subunit [Thermodesulfobacteriota bacterium]